MIYKPVTPKKKSWQGAALVIEVIDGDTIKCQVDLGFKISLLTNVRVLGCNSPELPTPAGVLALNFTRGLISPGDMLTLDSKRLDLYGRAEAVVTLADGSDLGARLLGSGHASPADDRGNLPTKESQPGTLPGLASTSTRENLAHR
jgi:endonuclease YncB( thermonuclease family)